MEENHQQCRGLTIIWKFIKFIKGVSVLQSLLKIPDILTYSVFGHWDFGRKKKPGHRLDCQEDRHVSELLHTDRHMQKKMPFPM